MSPKQKEHDITAFIFLWVTLHQNLYVRDKIKDDKDQSEMHSLKQKTRTCYQLIADS